MILHICPIVTRVYAALVDHDCVKAVLVPMKTIFFVHVKDAGVDVGDRSLECQHIRKDL